MFAAIVATHRTQLTTMAEAWLVAGATGFSLWQKEQRLACWPAEARPTEPDLIAPIWVGKKVWGELRVAGCSLPGAQARLATEAGLIGRLIELEAELENMTAELVDSQDQILALYDLSQSTRSHLELNQALRSLTQEVRRLLRAEGVFIALQAMGQPMIVEQRPALLLDEATLQDLFQQVQLTNQELLLPAGDKREIQPTHVFLKPISIEADQVAVLGVLFKEPAASLSPSLKLARAMAEHVGAQLENALLYHESLQQAKLKTELELAAQIQLQLLPHRPPQVARLDLAARSQPALQVGGDFYDFMAQTGSPFTFVVGDVAGKGMPAALLMAMTRTVMRSKASSLPTPTPELILGYANEIMYDDFSEVGMFATVFVGQYDETRGQLLYANAGHSPVIYCPAGGSARLLEADGPVSGVLPLSLSKNHTMNFQAGDLLIVATDGFNEARNAEGEMFGYPRLLRLAESVATKPAQEITEIFFQTVAQFSGHYPQHDDQTLLVVKGVAL